MQKKFIILIFFILPFTLFSQQNKFKKKWFLNIGVGPSKSLFYSSGGWARDWDTLNAGNKKVDRKAWAFSHFGELELQLNPKLAVRLGYSADNYFPSYKISGFSTNGTYYEIDTKESDRNLYIQLTAHYTILANAKNKLEIGAGLYNLINKRQEIQYYSRYYIDTLPLPVNAILIKDRKFVEGGIPFSLDYTRFIKPDYGIGFRINYNYTFSVQMPERLAFYGFVKIKL